MAFVLQGEYWNLKHFCGLQKCVMKLQGYQLNGKLGILSGFFLFQEVECIQGV